MLHSKWLMLTPTYSACVDNWGQEWHMFLLKDGYGIISTSKNVGLTTDPRVSLTGSYPEIIEAFEAYLDACMVIK